MGVLEDRQTPHLNSRIDVTSLDFAALTTLYGPPVTLGYFGGPPGSSTANPVQAFPGLSIGKKGGVVLLKAYYPVGVAGLEPRDSFLLGVPSMVPAGVCLMLPLWECQALIAFGVADPV